MNTESKRDRFIRIAEARTNKILEMLRLLGNCSSRSNYEYTDEDIKKIFGALEKELKNTKNATFRPVETKKEEPETPSAKLKRKYKFSLVTIVVLAIMIGAMFIIALKSNTPNILNYRTEIENEYADWAQQLSEKEEELRQRENALNAQ